MVVMGQVLAPFGVRGWVNVYTYTETADSLFDFPVWWLGDEGAWREVRVADAALHGKGIIALLEGVSDRDAAAALRGQKIAVPRDALPEPEADAWYWSDLVGLTVVGQDGAALGTVAHLLETGANDVLVVRGAKEHLIPFVDAIVQDVDLAARRIRVDWHPDW